MGATLEQKNNEPVDSGVISIMEIRSVGSKDNNLLIRDSRDSVLLEIEANSREEMGKFQYALQEALEIIVPELEGKAAKDEKRQRKLEELEARKQERQAKKDALGPVGMTATARIMMEQAMRK